MIWDEIIKRVISLPDRVSNIYKLPDGSILWPEGFFRNIGKMIVKVLKMVHAAVSGMLKGSDDPLYFPLG